MKAQKKPVVIDYIQWNGENSLEVFSFLNEGLAISDIGKHYKIKDTGKAFPELFIKTLEGDHRASIDDYIIKGAFGEFYPCKPEIFEATYDRIEEDGTVTSI